MFSLQEPNCHCPPTLPSSCPTAPTGSFLTVSTTMQISHQGHKLGPELLTLCGSKVGFWSKTLANLCR